MTREEFGNTRFRAGMLARYHQKVYYIASVNFQECLVALEAIDDDEWFWVRCENCEEIREEVFEDNPEDLVMCPEKHEGWANVFRYQSHTYIGEIYDTEEGAKKEGKICGGYVATIKVEWEE